MIGGGICFFINSFFSFVSSLVYLHDVIVILFFLVVINAPGILCQIAEQFISFCLDLKSPSCLFVNAHSYRCHSQSCFCRRFRFSSLNFILNYTDLYID